MARATGKEIRQISPNTSSARKRARALTPEERAALNRAKDRLRESVAALAGMSEGFERAVRDLRWATTVVDDTIRATEGGA